MASGHWRGQHDEQPHCHSDRYGGVFMRVLLIRIGVLSHCRKLCPITGPIPVIFSFVYGCVITYWFNSGKFDNCYSAKYTEVARAEAIAVICVPFVVMALSCVAFACLVHKEQQKAHSYQVRA